MKNYTFGVVASVLFLASGPLSVGIPQEPHFDLSVHISTPTYSYKLMDIMLLDVTIANRAKYPIYIENYLIPGSGGNVILTITDSMGNIVMPQDTMDAVLPFDSQGMLPVTQLKSNYFLGCTLHLEVNRLFRRPGKYMLTVTYRSQIAESSTQARPLWDYTKPALKSNIVTITIR
jgi:hypothetical protein